MFSFIQIKFIHLIKQTHRRMENRIQLVTACHNAPKALLNCSGFIKIVTNSLTSHTSNQKAICSIRLIWTVTIKSASDNVR